MQTLRQIRLDRGMSQTALAREVGCDPSTISYLESGDRTPSIPLAIRLAIALEVTLDQLIQLPTRGAA